MRVAIAFFVGGLLSLIGIRNRDVVQETVRRVTARGIRNNNPGNIRKSAIQWRGETPAALKQDPDFEEFIAPEWGIRAMGARAQGKRAARAEHDSRHHYRVGAAERKRHGGLHSIGLTANGYPGRSAD